MNYRAIYKQLLDQGIPPSIAYQTAQIIVKDSTDGLESRTERDREYIKATLEILDVQD